MIVMTFKEVAEAMRPPRALFVRFPIGLTLGAPGDVAQQRVIIEDALAFLGEAGKPGSLRTVPYRWCKDDFQRILKERQRQRVTKSATVGPD